ncbi:unnamed protein product [Miscanthus lutarioriparius]|uniref:G-patch domain-containing protein n=1 Tax=Miscanthus lutarioriparius TaxID=422564 RepID=A0A811MPP4_9POAL|nr:unnamed protein product [Miscanthus lutarioriparius]
MGPAQIVDSDTGTASDSATTHESTNDLSNRQTAPTQVSNTTRFQLPPPKTRIFPGSLAAAAAMEKEKKLSFSISSSKQRPPKPPARPAAAAYDDDADLRSAPAPAQQYVTEFDPSQTLAASAAARAVIAPLPNSGNFLTHRPRKPSSLPTPEEEAALAAESGGGGPAFVLDTSTAPDDPSSKIGYGLTRRNGPTDAAAAAAKESEKAPPPPPPSGTADAAAAGNLMLQRYKEDMDVLPEHRGMDEFNEVPVEGFGAALLAGYGWTEGKGIGRNNKIGDTKVVEYDRRAGTQGLGYNPSEADPRKTRSGDWIVGEKKASENGSAKRRDRDSRNRMEERDSSARKKRSSEQRSEKEGREKVRNGRGSGEGTSNASDTRSNVSNVRWLQSHIRVRIVSQKLSKRLYLMKGKVVDVVGPTTCDIMMDDGSELVQGVEQDMLETVLPRTNGRVLVLYGKHKGLYGHLVEKNSEEEIGLVEDADTKDIVRVRYDQMAEYTGDPELLGY